MITSRLGAILLGSVLLLAASPAANSPVPRDPTIECNEHPPNQAIAPADPARLDDNDNTPAGDTAALTTYGGALFAPAPGHDPAALARVPKPPMRSDSGWLVMAIQDDDRGKAESRTLVRSYQTTLPGTGRWHKPRSELTGG